MDSQKVNILLLRGLVREQRHWGTFPEILKNHVPGCQIFKLDLPGVGTELAKKSPSEMTGIVDDLRSRFLNLQVAPSSKWVCVSISLGSMVGLTWATRFPTDFRGLVTINTSAGDLSAPWERLRPLALASLLKSSLEKNMVQKEKHILSITTNLIGSSVDAYAQEWSHYVLPKEKLRETASRQLTSAIKFKLKNLQIKVPLKILVSLGDRLTHPNCSQKIADFFSLEPAVHPNAGHDLPLDDPEWTSKQVAQFIEGLSES